MQSRGKIFMFVFEQYKMIQYTMGKTELLYHCIDGSQSVSLSYLKLKLKLCFHFSFFTFSFSKPTKHEELFFPQKMCRSGKYHLFFIFHNFKKIIWNLKVQQNPINIRRDFIEWAHSKLNLLEFFWYNCSYKIF